MKRILSLIIVIFSLCVSGCNTKENQAKAVVEKHIKASLRDPNSLEIYSQKVEPDKSSDQVFIVTVDYGAKNGYGGMERTTERFKVIGQYVYKAQ